MSLKRSKMSKMASLSTFKINAIYRSNSIEFAELKIIFIYLLCNFFEELNLVFCGYFGSSKRAKMSKMNRTVLLLTFKIKYFLWFNSFEIYRSSRNQCYQVLLIIWWISFIILYQFSCCKRAKMFKMTGPTHL